MKHKTLYKFEVRNNNKVSHHKKFETAKKYQKKNGGVIYHFVGCKWEQNVVKELFIPYTENSPYNKEKQ